MNDVPVPGSQGPAASNLPSARVRLARLALETALSIEGVVEANAGPVGLRVTMDGTERLGGVVSTALPEGRYGVSLHLNAAMVPLPALGDRIRERVRHAAGAAGLGQELGPVDIVFEDVVEAEGTTTGPPAQP